MRLSYEYEFGDKGDWTVDQQLALARRSLETLSSTLEQAIADRDSARALYLAEKARGDCLEWYLRRRWPFGRLIVAVIAKRFA